MDLILGLAVSAHLGLAGTYNAVHPNARIQVQDYIAGIYYNSEENISVYAGKLYDFGKLDLEIGIVTGYSAMDSNIAPMLRATYELSENHKIFASPVAERYNRDYNYGVVIGLEFNIRK
jgi:hypothetical protein